MYRFNKLFDALLLTAAILTSSCYRTDTCSQSETCDYEDNNCNQQIDESFRDDDGVYFTTDHCGGCNIRCADVLSTAAETTCSVVDGTATCEIVACAEGFHRASRTTCAPDLPYLCQPCAEESDCKAFDENAECAQLSDGFRCLTTCGSGEPCEPGFTCDGTLCRPNTGECRCSADTLGAEFGCHVVANSGRECAGAAMCTEAGINACAPALPEVCNGEDDNCDDRADEPFLDDAGRYVHPDHCGACAQPCVAPGPQMVATCMADGASARCDLQCADGFVDVDGIRANGCECELWDGEGPPPAVGVDTDCDGAVDVTDDFVYVTPTGSDAQPGTLENPMRTVVAAIARANAESKDVLIARGIYEERVELRAGVGVFGGYRPDFRDRDLELFPTVILQPDPGLPAMRCDGITTNTIVSGLTIQAVDVTQLGAGNTALYARDCSAAVSFNDVTVFAARANRGTKGDSSSDTLGAPLSTLDGVDGTGGGLGTTCPGPNGGVGGTKSCGGGFVSGGDGSAAACPDIGCTNGSACGNAGCTDFTVGGVCDQTAMLAAATPNPSPEDGSGASGGTAGEPTYNAPTNRGTCNFCDDNPTLARLGAAGTDGGIGADGTPGGGCMTDLLVVGDGTFRGGDGSSGTSGSDGSGGGGGSSGGGYAVIGGTSGGCNDRPGGPGGGGGSGGCGAPGTRGGNGGGFAVAVAIELGALSTGPVFLRSRVVTASAGDGGDGGDGASGGRPGVGALGGGATFWCARSGGRGGDGGAGGAAGGGGGGCGGSSVAFLVMSNGAVDAYATSLRAQTIDMLGVGGREGRGGFSPTSPGVDGRRGQTVDVLSFLTP